jgi:hypothetical protein
VKRSDFDAWASQHRRVGVDLGERVERLQARERRRRATGAAR